MKKFRYTYYMRRVLEAYAQVEVEVEADDEDAAKKLVNVKIEEIVDDDEIEWGEPEFEDQWITDVEVEEQD